MTFNSAQIRICALAFMLLDHTAIVFFQDSAYYPVLRSIGRLAFPLFCFLLVEGYLHTYDAFRYILRVFGLSVLSQPLYILMTGNSCLNVCFLFWLALASFYLQKCCVTLPGKIAVAISFLILSLFCEYGILGMLLIYALYYLPDYPYSYFLTVLIVLVLLSFDFAGIAALSMVFMTFYDGTLGPKMPKLMVYGFYPVHMVLLLCIHIFV